MDNKYKSFFIRIDKAYGEAGGYSRLCELLDQGKFREGMDIKSYRNAKGVLLEFFSKHNTCGSDRLLGIDDFDIGELVKECEKRESSRSLQSA
jgi:hypothetical protein